MSNQTIADAERAGMFKLATRRRQRAAHTIEAYGVRGMKSLPWRKTFTDAEALNTWCDAHDAECLGTRQRDPGEIEAEGR